jgi:hypothetical protein
VWPPDAAKEATGIRVRARQPVLLVACCALWLNIPATAPASATPICHAGPATEAVVGQPTAKVAWRAELLGPTNFYGQVRELSRTPVRARGSVGPSQASWLLVLGAADDRRGGCWVKVRLPTRPNDASGWIYSGHLLLRPTAWRIVVSIATRTLTVDHAGIAKRHVSVVVGAPATPTPTGLFSIIGAWTSPPDAFLGSWILALTAHSDVLREFEGGDGTIGIHGRGGASLLDPLGSAASHGCIRLANSSIDWLVDTIGAEGVPGIPVEVG